MSGLLTKQLALHLKGALSADDGEMALVNQYTLRDFSPDEVQLREYVLAHNCIDRDNEVFDEPLLKDFADTLPGKGVYIKHPTSWQGDGGPAEGRVYAASTQTMSLDEARKLLREPNLQLPPDRSMVTLLNAKAYYAKTPDNQSLLIKQDAGIAGDVSIGFSAERSPLPIKDQDGRELTARRWASPGSALEMSLVWLGAQPGARATKSTKTDSEPEQQPMSLTKEEIEALQGKAAAGEKANGQLATLKTALGDHAVLLDNPAALKQHIADALAYKSSLVDDIVTIERQLKITGDTDEAVRDAKAFLSDMPVERLTSMRKGLEARLPTTGNIKGNTVVNQGAQGTDEPNKASPINNPALA